MARKDCQTVEAPLTGIFDNEIANGTSYSWRETRTNNRSPKHTQIRTCWGWFPSHLHYSRCPLLPCEFHRGRLNAILLLICRFVLCLEENGWSAGWNGEERWRDQFWLAFGWCVWWLYLCMRVWIWILSSYRSFLLTLPLFILLLIMQCVNRNWCGNEL